MQARLAKVAVFIALALALNHARCVAACAANPCDQERQTTPSCHHHKAPETKTDRGCAFPATNTAAGASQAGTSQVEVFAALEPLAITSLAPSAQAALAFADTPGGSPPGGTSISVIRI